MRIIYIIAVTLSFTLASLAVGSEVSEGDSLGTKLMQNALKLDPEGADPLKVEINPELLEDKYTKEPKFSGVSANQKKRDLVVAKISEKITEKSTANILNLQKCQDLGDMQEIKKCREAATDKKSK